MEEWSMGAPPLRRACASVVALFALACAASLAAAADPAADPTYLVILGQPEEFAEEFAPAPADSARQVGFAILLYTLNTPIEQMVRQVEQTLDTAERTGYPVLIHLDDWNYPAASSDPSVVEWTAFPGAGESHGPLVRRRWINWGSWFVVEAPPNYESPRFRADVTERFREVSRPIATRLRKWRAEGREHLFAGVVVGWESGFYTMPSFLPGERPRAGDQVLGDDEVVRTGYAALTARGWSAPSIRERARRQHKTEARVFDELMFDVVHGYTALLAGVCRSAGLPPDRIYTHYTGLAALPEASIPPPLRDDGRNIPLWAAVNRDSRPGITATVPWTDLARAAAVFRGRGHGNWGAVEVEFTDATRSEEDALRYLEMLSGSGARVICVFGWWEPPGHMFAVRGSGAVPAMRRWLAAAR
jgi:hypothetical protein